MSPSGPVTTVAEVMVAVSVATASHLLLVPVREAGAG
jgi:hypothetical protein